jgi:hypothetical protein
MGACQSNSASAPHSQPISGNKPVAAGDSSATSTHIATDELGNGLDHPTTGDNPSSGNHNGHNQDSRGVAPAVPTSRRKSKWHEKPGYSSGASSFSGEREESDRLADPLQLKNMRDLMHANGDLTQTVVRLETPFGKPIDGRYLVLIQARIFR